MRRLLIGAVLVASSNALGFLVRACVLRAAAARAVQAALDQERGQ